MTTWKRPRPSSTARARIVAPLQHQLAAHPHGGEVDQHQAIPIRIGRQRHGAAVRHQERASSQRRRWVGERDGLAVDRRSGREGRVGLHDPPSLPSEPSGSKVTSPVKPVAQPAVTVAATTTANSRHPGCAPVALHSTRPQGVT